MTEIWQLLKLPMAAFEQIIGQFNQKETAERTYKALVPYLQEDLRNGASIEDPDVKRAISVLSKLPPFGVRRINFNKYYLQSSIGILKLPNNPDRLAIAYWW